jgi:hypothetical protein
MYRGGSVGQGGAASHGPSSQPPVSSALPRPAPAQVLVSPLGQLRISCLGVLEALSGEPAGGPPEDLLAAQREDVTVRAAEAGHRCGPLLVVNGSMLTSSVPRLHTDLCTGSCKVSPSPACISGCTTWLLVTTS